VKSKIKKGLFWSFADSYGSFFLKFFFTIGIARMLTPSDYGLIAMLTIFISVATWISEGGFMAALVQNNKATDVDFNTGFYFNLGLSLFFFVLYFFSAPFIADFYNEAKLISVIRVYSLLLILNALTKTSYVILVKSIIFKKQAIVNYIATIVSGILGLIFAFYLQNYWALVILTLSGSFMRMVGYYVAVRWLPSLSFSLKSLKHQIKFSYTVFISGLLDSSFNEIYNIIIGKFYAPSTLGFFSQGRRFREMFVGQLALSFNKVFLPTFSNAQDDLEALSKMYYKAYRHVFMFSSFIMILLVSIIPNFVLFFLTEKWLPSVLIIQIFLIEGFYYPLYTLNINLLISIGKPNRYLLISVIHKVVSVFILIFTFKLGLNYVVAGWICSGIIGFVISEFVLSKHSFSSIVKFKELGRILLPIIFIIPIALLIYKITFLPPLLIMIMHALILPISYIGLLRLFRLEEYDLIKEVYFKYKYRSENKIR